MRSPAVPWRSGINWKYSHFLRAVVAVLVFIAVSLILWEVFYRGQVVDYGPPGNTFFVPARAVEGDTIMICFRQIEWKKPCLSTLETRITPTQGPALELEDYSIKTPPEKGQVKEKCRPWKVPSLGGNDENGRPIRQEGPAIVSGQVRSECTPLDHWRSIKTPMPSIPLNWLRRAS